MMLTRTRTRPVPKIATRPDPRKSPTTVIRHVYVCRAMDQNSSGWQIICCCRTMHRYGTVCRQICA